ncbi:protein lingerer isoform X2 [Phymastichus coffea]|uniref:protein lingerer isoform X2 n=1 Tax=Phymastichus coffea TaxID=108790 RepID=UPI00273CB494|nr:protein lingerer isoform X2 [Phymastichus coffea]
MSSINKISDIKSNIKTKTTLSKNNQTKMSSTSKCDKLQLRPDFPRPVQDIDIHINSKDDIVWQERIKQVMELTSRSEDEAIMALHDSDGDLNRAVNDLLEGVSPEWEVKKKKARQSAGSKSITEQVGEMESNIYHWNNKCLIYNDGSSHNRGRANHNNRGWRRRENKENEKIISHNKVGIEFNIRRGRIVTGRSGRGGKSGGRGMGPRTFAHRGEQIRLSNNHNFTKPIETWTGTEEQTTYTKDTSIDSWHPVDVSEDWDNEEYTGSLADTKVFTPSLLPTKVINTSENHLIDETFPDKLSKLSHSIVQNNSSQMPIDETEHNQSPLQITSSVHVSHSFNTCKNKSLSAAQSEYFSQISENTNDCLNTSSAQSTFITAMTNQTQKQGKQRSRVPPPSKIPSSAVEMPDDALNASINYLDVQFGALEFGSDANINDSSNQDKYVSSECNANSSHTECTTITSKNVVNPNNQLEPAQISSQKLNSTVEMLHGDNQSQSNESSKAQTKFTNRNTSLQPVDVMKQEIHTSLNSSSSYNSPVTFQSSPKYSTSTTSSNFSTYSLMTPAAQTSYGSSYTKPNTFNQTLPSSCGSTGVYNQTATTSQTFQATSGFTIPISQYQSQTSSTTVSNTNSTYMPGGYQSSSSFQPTAQSYQPPHTTFTSSMSQATSVYSNPVQSVYSNTYPNYVSQNQQGSQDNKVMTNKDISFETTSSSSLVTSTTCNLNLSSTSVSTSQTKTTITNVIPKCSVGGLTPSSNSSSSSISGSAASGSLAPILSHQYIMGQSVPYATFQQPHVYSYEDLQLIQQRMPHMPTTGYYDAALSYQTTGPVTSLGSSRSDTLSGVQSVQGVQTVQAQYTSINDGRFARTDSNASPVPSTISQQTTQHQQPLINPIPPGYAYFYGGGIMPASGFQYGTPAIYPQIATAGSAGNSSGSYSTKPGNYNSTYGGATNYDTLSSSGSSGDYKNSTSGYSNSQNKNSSTNNSTNTANSSEISTTMYSKGHVTLNKVNSYEKQTFHSATPPPFGLTNSQSANVIGGYGTAHLFIPTVPHQLHQPIHQDNTSSTGQRTNSNSQNKAQAKSGYNTSYWTGGN